jgi:hypothetical protein
MPRITWKYQGLFVYVYKKMPLILRKNEWHLSPLATRNVDLETSTEQEKYRRSRERKIVKGEDKGSLGRGESSRAGELVVARAFLCSESRWSEAESA